MWRVAKRCGRIVLSFFQNLPERPKNAGKKKTVIVIVVVKERMKVRIEKLGRRGRNGSIGQTSKTDKNQNFKRRWASRKMNTLGEFFQNLRTGGAAEKKQKREK